MVPNLAERLRLAQFEITKFSNSQQVDDSVASLTIQLKACNLANPFQKEERKEPVPSTISKKQALKNKRMKKDEAQEESKMSKEDVKKAKLIEKLAVEMVVD